MARLASARGRGRGPDRAALALVAALCSGTAAEGQQPDAPGPGLLERAGLSGSVRAGYWSSTRDLDEEDHLGEGMVWLKATRSLSDRVSFLVEGWTAFRGPDRSDDASGELREAFVDVRLGRFDLRAGRQIVAWGRADGINPTDNVTGEDLTLLAPDDDERRLGTAAVRGRYFLGGVSLTALWLPEFRGHRFPIPAAVAAGAPVREARRWAADRWALRVERTGGNVDWSVSHLHGVDLTPDLGLQQESDALGPNAHIRLAHHRLRVLGGDVAVNAGRFALRAEAAYVDTEDGAGVDPFAKNPFVFVVAGGDRTFGEYLNVNLQYLYRQVMHFRAPAGGASLAAAVAGQQAVLNSETRRVQHGASVRLAHRWLRETLEAECAAVAFFGPRGLALRPKLAFALSDHWKLLAGAEVLRGEDSSLPGLLRPNSAAYLEARWSF